MLTEKERNALLWLWNGKAAPYTAEHRFIGWIRKYGEKIENGRSWVSLAVSEAKDAGAKRGWPAMKFVEHCLESWDAQGSVVRKQDNPLDYLPTADQIKRDRFDERGNLITA